MLQSEHLIMIIFLPVTIDNTLLTEVVGIIATVNNICERVVGKGIQMQYIKTTPSTNDSVTN